MLRPYESWNTTQEGTSKPYILGSPSNHILKTLYHTIQYIIHFILHLSIPMDITRPKSSLNAAHYFLMLARALWNTVQSPVLAISNANGWEAAKCTTSAALREGDWSKDTVALKDTEKPFRPSCTLCLARGGSHPTQQKGGRLVFAQMQLYLSSCLHLTKRYED